MNSIQIYTLHRHYKWEKYTKLGKHDLGFISTLFMWRKLTSWYGNVCYCSRENPRKIYCLSNHTHKSLNLLFVQLKWCIKGFFFWQQWLHICKWNFLYFVKTEVLTVWYFCHTSHLYKKFLFEEFPFRQCMRNIKKGKTQRNMHEPKIIALECVFQVCFWFILLRFFFHGYVSLAPSK